MGPNNSYRGHPTVPKSDDVGATKIRVFREWRSGCGDDDRVEIRLGKKPGKVQLDALVLRSFNVPVKKLISSIK